MCLSNSRFGYRLLLHGVSSVRFSSTRIIYVSVPKPVSVQYKVIRKLEWNKSVDTFSKNIYLYSTSSESTPSKASNTAKTTETQKKNKKQDSGPVITLIGTDNNITILSLLEAEKISKRRDLKLIKVVDLDTKTQRPIYKLMSGAQYYEEDRKRKQEKSSKNEGAFKGEKLLTLSHRITDHDLSSRIKNIKKWLSKTYEVRIVINGDAENMKNAERVCDGIVESVKTEGRIVQKRQKGSDIRFQILPPKKEKAEKDQDSEQESSSAQT
ncbi:translation initiation factor IF-3 [Periplaneta americana]|uniref:translation initiation factor IF-3 n=1 Tax=Periplaneta americana TaxID=6978 RepID=UPI0037E7C36A